ncbi:hypothetical protein R3P38DRAFT_2988030 [Favolaschia claudopus]|uniref:F-box domain-containing protein n=1 Tax=Favolaschia claudopus TaxID=2862362 RepID=A0AAW0AUK1_9AGAR
MDYFSSLAVEILHLICAFCAIPEIRHLRLTCKSISAVADEYLLPVVELYYCYESIRFAEELSRSRVSSSIRLLCFHADRLNGQQGFYTTDETPGQSRRSVLTYDGWMSGRDPDRTDGRWEITTHSYPESPLRVAYNSVNAPCQAALRKGAAKIQQMKEASAQRRFNLEAAYEHYLRLWSEQVHLDGSDTLETTLETLFAECPRLVDVIVSCGDSLVPTTTYRVQDFTRALACPNSDPESPHSGVHTLNSVLSAATKTNKKIRMLGAGKLGYEFFLQDPRTLALFAPTFTSLEKLLLQLETPYHLRNREKDELRLLIEPLSKESNQQIPHILQQMVNLRDLTIIMPGLTSYRGVKTPLAGILGNAGALPHWRHLQRLRIEWCSTDEDYIVSLLLRHAETLEFLRLADLDFSTTGDWPDAFTRLSCKLPRLRTLELRGAFQRAKEIRMYSFPPGKGLTIGNWPDEALMHEVQEFVLHGTVGGIRSVVPPPHGFHLGEKFEQPDDKLEEYLQWWIG